MNRDQYVEPPEASREAFAIALASGQATEIADALVGLVLSDPDWEFAEITCLALLGHSESQIRGLAVTCLGHVARVHGRIDVAAVSAAIETAAARDPAVARRAADALDDIRQYAREIDPRAAATMMPSAADMRARVLLSLQRVPGTPSPLEARRHRHSDQPAKESAMTDIDLALTKLVPEVDEVLPDFALSYRDWVRAGEWGLAVEEIAAGLQWCTDSRRANGLAAVALPLARTMSMDPATIAALEAGVRDGDRRTPGSLFQDPVSGRLSALVDPERSVDVSGLRRFRVELHGGEVLLLRAGGYRYDEATVVWSVSDDQANEVELVRLPRSLVTSVESLGS